MKKIVTLALVICTAAVAVAQIKNPVKWTYTSRKINPTTYEVHLIASIDGGWHIYSQSTPAGGPVPTTISFTKNPLLIIEGMAKEVGVLEQHHEELFGIDVKQFSGKLELVQRVTLKVAAKTAVVGKIEYMTCNDHECLPPKTQSFSVDLK